MNEQQPFPAEDIALSGSIVVVMCVAAGLSLLGGFFLFQRHVGGAPLLKYEPRRRSPWGPLVLCIPLMFILSGLAQSVLKTAPPVEETVVENGEDETVDQADDVMSADEFVSGVLLFSTVQMGFVFAALAWFTLDSNIKPSDFGWPESTGQFAMDVVRGVVACVAALLPVIILNIVLFHMFNSDQQHPMIEQFQKGSTPLMFFAGAIAAVISAPIFEEFSFRVLLQGWLEKLEDESLNFQATAREPVVENSQSPHDLSRVPEELFIEPPTMTAKLDSSGRPARGWWSALPHGWLPILISATFFGLAHLGHGVAPIPLVLLGIVLGYLYQRTHRIVPCIAAHMLFNAYSMLLLWLSS